MTEDLTNTVAEQGRTCLGSLTESLVKAAGKEGVEIDKSSISIGIGPNGELAMNSAVAGLARIDPLDYESGVVTNVVYSSFSGRNLPQGFHVVTTRSDWVRRGVIHTRLSFSQGGQRVAVMPGRGIITSLLVPDRDRDHVRTGLRLGTAFPGDLNDWQEVDWNADPPTITYYTACSNGQYSCSEPEPYAD